MRTREVLEVLAKTKTGRLSRSSPQLAGVRNSTWHALARRGSVVLDDRSAYVVITDSGRQRVAVSE